MTALSSAQTGADFAPWTVADTVLVTASVGALVVIIVALSLPEIIRRWREASTVIDAERLTAEAAKR